MEEEMEFHSEDSTSDAYYQPESPIQPGSPLREQDRFLPIANITKVMKRGVPPNGKIAKDARDCIQECVSEFISFITSEASDRCHMEKRKTINGEDVLCAMYALGFDNYIEPLKMYLNKYRATSSADRPVVETPSEEPERDQELEPEPEGEPVPATATDPNLQGQVGATYVLPANIAPTDIIYQTNEGELFYRTDRYGNF